jgi:hypothetical protein
MENMVVRRLSDENASDMRRFPVMRTLAKLGGCDIPTICGTVDVSELDVSEILWDMVGRDEVARARGACSEERFTLTAKGWVEYIDVLGSLYELPE